jgi:hypothetical protein
LSYFLTAIIPQCSDSPDADFQNSPSEGFLKTHCTDFTIIAREGIREPSKFARQSLRGCKMVSAAGVWL